MVGCGGFSVVEVVAWAGAVVVAAVDAMVDVVDGGYSWSTRFGGGAGVRWTLPMEEIVVMKEVYISGCARSLSEMAAVCGICLCERGGSWQLHEVLACHSE